MNTVSTRSSFGLVVCLLSSCARAPHAGTPTPRPLSIDDAMWQAREQFTEALQAGDTARVAALFAPNALLVAPAGDSVRGAEAIMIYLAGLNAQRGWVDVSLGREGSMDECVGAGREHLSYTAHWAARDSVNSKSGQLAVFWQRDAAGELRVAWIAFPPQAMQRRLTAAECRSVNDSVLHDWRWAVSVVPASLLSSNRADQSFSQVLQDRGWTGLECSCGGNVRHTPITEGSILPPTLLSIQYHVTTHLVAELGGGAYPKTTTMGAQEYPNRDYAQTRMWFSGGFAQAVVSYQLGIVQTGIGPVVQFSHWRMRDSLIPYSTGGYPSHTDYEWSESAVGVVGHLRLQWPFGRRAFLSLGTQWRAFSKVKTPTTPRFPEASVDQSGVMLGLGIGMFF